MNTQTHVIMGAALFGRKVSSRAWAGAAGGIVPDVPMLLIVLVLKFWSVPDAIIFGFLYWQNWWQVANAIGHNFWLWGGLLALALYMRDRTVGFMDAVDRWTLLAIFAGSSLLHVAIDFLCHREDAHMSLWPVTRWKFISPVSYWDDKYYGRQFGIFEMALGFALAIVLFRQFKNIWLRGALCIAMALYVAVPIYFIFLN